MIPTLFGITIVTFVIINFAPGSPIEQRIQQMKFGGMGQEGGGGKSNDKSSAVSEEVIEALKKQYGFDKPVHVRYWIWLKNISRLDFGESFTYEEPVLDVISSKFPVSLQFGVVSLIMSYLVCIALGVLKAVKHDTAFDYISTVMLFIVYSIPGFMLAILLIVYFAGGSFYSWFPMGELYSDNYYDLSTWGKIVDRLHHFVLPLICYMIGSFTVLTMLMKNSLLDEIKKRLYSYGSRERGVGAINLLKTRIKKRTYSDCYGYGGLSLSILCRVTST